jgi:hypothetical protein
MKKLRSYCQLKKIWINPSKMHEKGGKVINYDYGGRWLSNGIEYFVFMREEDALKKVEESILSNKGNPFENIDNDSQSPF